MFLFVSLLIGVIRYLLIKYRNMLKSCQWHFIFLKEKVLQDINGKRSYRSNNVRCRIVGFLLPATPRWCLIVVRWNPVNLSRHPALCCPYLWAIVFLRCISPYFQRWRKGVFRPAGCRFSSYDPAPRSCLLSATHPSKSRPAFQSKSSRCPELLHVVAILY